MSKLIKHFGEEWYSLLKPMLESDYFNKLGKEVLGSKFDSRTIYPPKEDIFKAFRLCPPSKTKVVILGQDPYHDKGSAVGLAFSNKPLSKPSPSVRNILKEVEQDVYDGLMVDYDPDLHRWAEQGVLLLNTALTVEEGKPGSHAKYWDRFTKFVLEALSKTEVCVYLLWGAHAKGYIDNIDRESNFILTAAHPSPFSANKGFFGCKHFSKCNEILTEMAKGLDIDPEDYKIKW
jgi:uracil-DNA glycosylase